MPPDAAPLYRTFRQLFPPSVDLKMPRSSLLTPYFPKSATNTMFGFVGWMRMREIASEFPKPTFVQVFPASVDLYTPSPGWMSPRMHDSPMPMKTTFGSVALTATAPTDELWICPSVMFAQCSPPSVVFQSPPPVAPRSVARAGSAGGTDPPERHPASDAIRAIEKTMPNRERDIGPDPRQVGGDASIITSRLTTPTQGKPRWPRRSRRRERNRRWPPRRRRQGQSPPGSRGTRRSTGISRVSPPRNAT